MNLEKSKKQTDSYDDLFDKSLEMKISDSQRPGEIAAVRDLVPSHASSVGNLATRNLSPDVRQSIEWVEPENGLQKKVPGIHLGARKNKEGLNIGFIDKSVIAVPEAGIYLVLAQASQGLTAVESKAMAGFEVEAAKLDPETGEVTWQKADAESGEVSVARDRGNIMNTPFDNLDNSVLGNE